MLKQQCGDTGMPVKGRAPKVILTDRGGWEGVDGAKTSLLGEAVQ